MIIEVAIGLLLVQDAIGSGLRDGVHLIYESGGTAQAPWIYESVRVVERGGFERCVVVARQGQAERESCVRGDTLFERQASGEHAAVRPIGPAMELELRTASGSVLHYTTGDVSTRRIGDRTVAFVTTTILTTNADGVVTRRLREEYAPSLLTALWGIFEQPDDAGGWRTATEFTLARIEPRQAPNGT
jgi:hypothetical protein